MNPAKQNPSNVTTVEETDLSHTALDRRERRYLARQKLKVGEKPDLSALLREMPPYVARNFPRFRELTGYSPRTMANMDALGETTGIKRIMLGNVVAYERESLVKWLESRSRILS
jgi:hypothetical protein